MVIVFSSPHPPKGIFMGGQAIQMNILLFLEENEIIIVLEGEIQKI